MLKIVLSLVVISLEATRLRRHTEAVSPGGLGAYSDDNLADAVVLACTPGTFDWTGATGAAAMPEALMSAVVNFAANAFSSETKYQLQKSYRCEGFVNEGSDYAANVLNSLENVYRHIIFPMNLYCVDEPFKKQFNCAWDAFATDSLGLWKQGMVGWHHLGDTAGNIGRKEEKIDQCAKVVADIVTLYREVFNEAWDIAAQIKEQGYLSAKYKQILQPFLVKLIGEGGNVNKEPGVLNKLFGIGTRTHYQKLSWKICRKIGCGYREVEAALTKLKEAATKF